MKDTGSTLFVGGPRHGRTITGSPEKEGELYRVPARSKKDKPQDYKAAQIVLTFPDPLHPDAPGETYASFVYVIPELYPDNQKAGQDLQVALPEACLRLYIMEHGDKTSGGPQAVAAQQVPVYVAWCNECLGMPDPEQLPAGSDYWPQETEFATLKERAGRIMSHKTTTGHTARWEDRKR